MSIFRSSIVGAAIPVMFSAVCLLAIVTSSCSIDDAFLLEENVFFCNSGADCPEPGFICDPATNRCIIQNSGPRDCMDNDGDGYGIGEDRRMCMFSELDPDDTNEKICPTCADDCDGLDNDGDGETDVIPCGGGDFCPQSPSAGPVGSIGFCEGGRCVYKPKKQNQGPECMVTLACNGQGGWQPVPDTCM